MKPVWALVPVGLLLLGAGAATFCLSPHERVIASFNTSLEGRSRSQRHNAQLAFDRLDDVVIAPGGVFSFNKQVGTFSRDQGFRRAPVSYNGQLISDWGGGVCQASTTVYNAALLANMDVVERHRHRFCPKYIDPGRDAAVAFSNIDLKFRNPHLFPVRLKAWIDGERLRVDLLATQDLPVRPVIVPRVTQVDPAPSYQVWRKESEPGLTRSRVRNSGKDGYEVVVYRFVGDHKERISFDSYPAMGRVVER